MGKTVTMSLIDEKIMGKSMPLTSEEIKQYIEVYLNRKYTLEKCVLSQLLYAGPDWVCTDKTCGNYLKCKALSRIIKGVK